MHATPAGRVALLLFFSVRSTKFIAQFKVLRTGYGKKKGKNFKKEKHVELWSLQQMVE